jgi:hypothetical protein
VPANFDAEMEATEKELEGIKSELESISRQFLLATAELVRHSYRQLVETLVKDKPKLTKRLGVERLSQLKVDLRELENNAQNAVSEFLDVDKLWWHRAEGDQQYSDLPQRHSDLDKALMLAVGKLAPVLEKYGYLPTESTDPGIWREWDKTARRRALDARPYYPHRLEWSQSMKDSIQRYAALHAKGLETAAKLARLKEEKASREAEELWRKA